MKRLFLISLVGLVLISLAVGLSSPAQAMPEYATRVGEPCGTCHVSPAGGGVRNVRGQAWVAEGKPNQVPSTMDALKILGVELPSDMSIYTDVQTPASPPAPLPLQHEPLAPLLDRLQNREGN